MYSTVNLKTYCFRCKSSDVSWEPVPTGKALMGSVTQSQRFSFPLVSLIPYMNRYIFLRCRLTVCRNYQTINNKDIPQVCTVKPVLRGHIRDKKKWSYKTGDLLKEVQLI